MPPALTTTAFTVELPVKPKAQGPLQTIDLQTLQSVIKWLLAAVKNLEGSLIEVTSYISDPDRLQHEEDARQAVLDRLAASEGVGVAHAEWLARLEGCLEKQGLEMQRVFATQEDIFKELQRFNAIEERAAEHEASLRAAVERIGSLEAAVTGLQGRVDQLEARLNNNICKIPGSQPIVVQEQEVAVAAVVKAAPELEDEFKKRLGSGFGLKPLYQSREMLDLRNQRGIRNLSKEQEGLKDALVSFEAAIKGELAHLGELINTTRSDIMVELQSYTHYRVLDARLIQEGKAYREMLQEADRARDQKVLVLKGQIHSELEPRFEGCEARASELASFINKSNEGIADVAIRLRKLEMKLSDDPKDKSGRQLQSIQTLSKVDMKEEIFRLRGMVESIQQALPAGTRHKLAFLGDGSAGAHGGPSGWADPVIMQAVEEHAQRCTREFADEQQRNTSIVLRSYERDLQNIGSKVEEMWSSMPKVTAMLESALQGPVAGTATTCASLPELVRSTWREKWDEFRGDVQAELMRVSLEALASMEVKMSSLDAKVDAWTQHAPGCAHERKMLAVGLLPSAGDDGVSPSEKKKPMMSKRGSLPLLGKSADRR